MCVCVFACVMTGVWACKQVSSHGRDPSDHLYSYWCYSNHTAPLMNIHGYIHAHKRTHIYLQHAPLLALLQSAQLQNNGRMFRPATIPQWLSDEGEPGIIQAVLISGRDPISIFRPGWLIRAAPDKCVVMEWYLWSEVDESLMNGYDREVMKGGVGVEAGQ